ncbi:hypothetical protein NDU88_005142 [Pleurodeles waltl]|uniref:Uncharacterized protein n=1 Tax=Pleurodeles waltl TaxID=8319 RepID=A0AAV7NLL6_PLEWA|nr:hypothetical protein NDU88_005142 [Pleurodeles waltl]
MGTSCALRSSGVAGPQIYLHAGPSSNSPDVAAKPPVTTTWCLRVPGKRHPSRSHHHKPKEKAADGDSWHDHGLSAAIRLCAGAPVVLAIPSSRGGAHLPLQVWQQPDGRYPIRLPTCGRPLRQPRSPPGRPSILRPLGLQASVSMLPPLRPMWLSISEAQMPLLWLCAKYSASWFVSDVAAG